MTAWASKPPCVRSIVANEHILKYVDTAHPGRLTLTFLMETIMLRVALVILAAVTYR
jgi:hypothetical protein